MERRSQNLSLMKIDDRERQNVDMPINSEQLSLQSATEDTFGAATNAATK